MNVPGFSFSCVVFWVGLGVGVPLVRVLYNPIPVIPLQSRELHLDGGLGSGVESNGVLPPKPCSIPL